MRFECRPVTCARGDSQGGPGSQSGAPGGQPPWEAQNVHFSSGACGGLGAPGGQDLRVVRQGASPPVPPLQGGGKWKH